MSLQVSRAGAETYHELILTITEDTFALLDALEQDAEQLVGSRLCLEIG